MQVAGSEIAGTSGIHLSIKRKAYPVRMTLVGLYSRTDMTYPVSFRSSYLEYCGDECNSEERITQRTI